MSHAIPLLLCALLALPAGAGAEPLGDAPSPPQPAAESDQAWSVSLGTGAGGFAEFVDAFAGTAPGSYDASRQEDRLQLNARADRELSRWFRAGLAWTYNRWTEVYLSGGARVGSIENTIHVLLADCTLRWYRAEHLELYSALAAGAGRWKQEGDGIGASKDGVSSGFAFQLRYAGISAGNDRVRAFLDLGIGFEGLVVGGVTVRL